jgi:hypothetical protein
MAMNKLRYHFAEEEAEKAAVDGCEQTFFLSQTVDRGINTNGVLHFSFPADPTAFTDTTETIIKVKLRVFHSDGTLLGPEDKVFPSPSGILALFKTCVVSINGTPLPPTNLYPYCAHITTLLGTSKAARDYMWQFLGLTEVNYIGPSKLDEGSSAFFIYPQDTVAGSKQLTLYGRVHSDMLLTCAQLLPPGMKLDITLTRSPDSFALTAIPGAGGGSGYKLEIESATVFLKRLQLGAGTLGLVRQSLSGGGKLRYNRLATEIQQIPSGSLVFRWNNVYNGGPLPHMLYVVLVKQLNFYGDIHTLPVYFETAELRSFRVLNNGRDVLPEPYTFSYTEEGNPYTNSDLKAAFMGLVRALNLVSGQSNGAMLRYADLVTGGLVLAAPINTCGGRRVQPGSLDLELEFKDPSTKPEDRLL